MEINTETRATNGRPEEENRYKVKARELVALMTLEEKAGLCSGLDTWNLKPVPRLGLESIMMSDGPHGLRKQIAETDNFGIGDSIPSVCFPTSSALACSFDRELAYEIGSAIGEECLQEGVSVVLGPGANQKRSPLCGRNFEYYSEDPVLSGELAAAMIKGVQSHHIGTSLKHFAVNNQEKRRMTINAVIDERTLRETYLKAFEIAVKKGKPSTVMCAYNRINGEYCSEYPTLLTKILREEWGYDGVVVSDWGAVNDRVLGIKAGMDIEMPGSLGVNDAKIITAVNQGTLAEEDLDRAAIRITELILKGMENRKENYTYDTEAHHQLAIRAAAQSAVLLKNEDRLLPGNRAKTAAVIGAFAKEPRYQGAGSSKIHPIQIDNAWDVLRDMGLELTYAQGYDLEFNDTRWREKSKKDKKDKKSNDIHARQIQREEELIAKACEAAKGKDIVYLFAGLLEGYESEGFDRTELSLPKNQNRLIEAVAACNVNVAVIIFGGAPMELPWLSKVKSVLLAYLGGEGVGKAVADLLLGKAVPCGKLAETWPLKHSDTPAYHYFPGNRTTVEYRESIYVGYRYYEAAGKKVQFPFGFGLSYTEFTYSNLQLDREECNYGDQIKITFQITNIGELQAKETALIFVSHKNDKVFLPQKELREFVKVILEPGETKQVSVVLDTADFGYYNTEIKSWYAESGTYTILVGASSQACSLSAQLRLNSPDKPQPDLRSSAPSYYRLPEGELQIPELEFQALYGKPLPSGNVKPVRPYNAGNTLEDVEDTFIGRIILKNAERIVMKATNGSSKDEGMMSATIREMPLHSLLTNSEGIITERMLEGIIDLLNGHLIRGIFKIFRK